MVKVFGAKAGTVEGYASGIIVSADGKILTTQGVFLDGSQVQVILSTGEACPATVIRRDRKLQVSLLDIGRPTPDFFDVMTDSVVKQGDWVIAISNAFKVADQDEPLSVMMGVVSLQTSMEAKLNDRDVAYSGPLILIDAITSNPGAAGGALLDRSGRLVGQIGRIIDSSETNTRLNYAVPTSALQSFLSGDATDSAESPTERVGQPLDLGIKIFTLSGRSAAPYVDRVISGGWAAQAGIKPDDLIVSIAGEKIANVAQYQNMVKALTDETDVVIVAARKQELLRFVVPARAKPASTAAASELAANNASPPTLSQPVVETTPSGRVSEADPALDSTLVDTSPLWAVPPLTRAALQRIRPSLVTIESFAGITAMEGVIGGIRKQGEGNTTGVVVGSDGWVVTSLFNFARNPRIITVVLADGTRRVAKIVGRDLSRNLCLLRVEEVSDLPVPTWVPQESIRVGQYAISLGVGYGDTRPAVSLGIISAMNRIGGRAIQTDANISPANYGGPLVDLEGRVLGICVPLAPGGLSSAAGVEWYDSGIGFAVSLDQMEWWLERLKNGENIYPGIIGVTVKDNPDGPGVQIVQVIPNSGADNAGLLAKDVLLELDGKPISAQADLQNPVKRMVAGETLEVLRLRDGLTEKVQITLTPHPDTQPKSRIPGLPPLEELR
jgi:serine protease Do